MKELVIIGAGGHSASCIDVIEQTEQFKIAAIVDLPEKENQKILNYSITNTDKDLPHLAASYENFFIAIGQIKSAQKRIEVFNLLKKYNCQLPTIISPRAYVSKYASIGEGTIVMHDALVNANVKIGHNCIVNSKALIEHDSVIGNHCHISTGSILNGGCQIGDGSFLGSQSVTKEGINISPQSVISAGTFFKKGGQA